MHDGHAGFVELAMELGGKLDCFCAVKSLFLGRTLWIQRIRYQHDIEFQYLYPAMPLQLLANQNAALIQSSFNQERKRLSLFLLRGLALRLALC